MPNSLKCKIKHLCHNGTINERERDRILKALEQEPILDKLPPVQPKTEWIPIKTRPLTEGERQYFDGYGDFAYDCPLPYDGQEVLITTRYGHVITDTFCRDDGCYFEYCDDGDVLAWMPLPEPYTTESEGKE